MVKPMKAPLGGNLLLMVWYRDSISDKKRDHTTIQ
jgi:hypothetical protein